MLAGELYFYNQNGEVIEKMDLFDYEKMSEKEFLQFLKKIDCFKATLHGFYNNYQKNPTIKVIYERIN